MNLAEILKDCPKGTKLYSLLFGIVRLYEIRPNEIYSIAVYYNCNDGSENIETFTKDGKLYDTYADGECVLFPSKENRDWSTFKASKKEYNFKAFDRCRFKMTKDGDFHYAKYWYLCLNYALDQLYIIEKWED